MSNTDKVFAGSVPKLYDTHMVPLIFEPYAADLADRCLEIDESLRIFLGDLRNFLDCFFGIVVKDERAPVRGKGRYGHFGRYKFQTMFFELHVADDISAQRPGVVRQDGATKSGMKFLCDGGATNLRSSFEYQRFEARLREVESRDESVVSATDDDDVACLGHELGRSLHVFQNFESRQTPVRAHDASARMGC